MLKRKIHLAIIGSFILVLTMAESLAETEGVHSAIKEIKHHNVVVEPFNNNLLNSNARVLFSKDINQLSGWNHVENYPDEFTQLFFKQTMYQINNKPVKHNDNGFYSTTLVKKIADWHHQHANGITSLFSDISFKHIKGIEVVLKINSKTSHIPTTDTIIQRYQYLAHEDDLKALDDENIYLSFALRNNGKGTVESPQFNADLLLSLHAKKQIDQWLYVFIPQSQLTRYNEVNYNSTVLSDIESSAMIISGFKLTAETKSTKVIRNFIPKSFNKNTPSLFKEIGVDIEYIGIVKHEYH